MEKVEFTSSWKSFRGDIKARWKKLTDADIDKADGNLDALTAAVQSRYERSLDLAQEDVNNFRKDMPAKPVFELSGTAGGPFTITGEGFGSRGDVNVGGVPVTINSWNDHTIVGQWPLKMESGTVTVLPADPDCKVQVGHITVESMPSKDVSKGVSKAKE